MKKLKWYYDSKFKQWYICESAPYAGDGWRIKKDENIYYLEKDFMGCSKSIGRFTKLKNAKQVAQLIHNG